MAVTNIATPYTPAIDPVLLAGTRKILLCQLRQIGDVLLATPALELLAKRFPDAQIHFLTEKKCMPILDNNPHLAKVWGIDKKYTLLQQTRFYLELAKEKFDLVIDFQQLPRCRWAVALSRAKVRLSYTPPWYNRWLYTHWSDPEKNYAGASKASILKPLGIYWKGEAPRLYLTETERHAARKLCAELGIKPGQILVTVDPTHRHSTRCWPAGHYAELLRLASASRPELSFLLLYGPGEEEDVRHIYNLANLPDRVFMPPKMLSLRHMAACIADAALHLGNCSAPRHIAVAVDTPSLTILGSTSTGWTFPAPQHDHLYLGLECQPCNKNTCPDQQGRCLKELTPTAALPVLIKKLQATLPWHGLF